MNRQHGSDLALLTRILGVAKPLWLPLTGLLVLDLLTAPITLLMPVPVKIAVDSVLGVAPLPAFLAVLLPASWQSSKGSLLGIAIVMVIVVALLQQLCHLGASLLRFYCSDHLTLLLRGTLFRHAQRLSLAFHDRQAISETFYRIQYDAVAGEGTIIRGILPMLGSLATVIVMLVVIVRLDWQLTLVAMAICPVLIITTNLYRPRLRKGWNSTKEIESSVLQVVQETLSILPVVIAFGQEHREQERFTSRSKLGIRAKLRVTIIEGTFGIIVGLTVAAGTAGVLYLGIRHVQEGTLLLGTLLLVMLYLAMLYQPLTALGENAAAVQSALASAGRAFEMLDEVPEVTERPDSRAIERATGDIEFVDVCFAYRDSPTLTNLSFHIPAGTRVGVFGPTGAGKSTILSLLPRFYDPTSGVIKLDGVDLRDYKLTDLREQFSIVLQDTSLVSTTIAENIAYGSPGASRADVIEAARLANADEFISRLPDGYETQVGDRGARLSGGERQRIALARAFLRNAPILILDEPTSAVDVKTESLVIDALNRLMEGRTCFLISHRPGTLDHCDLLLRVERGAVAVTEQARLS